MISWIILLAITTGFLVGTYYLYQFWERNDDFEDLFKTPFKKIDNKPRIDKKVYEDAYRNNTNFVVEASEEKASPEGGKEYLMEKEAETKDNSSQFINIDENKETREPMSYEKEKTNVNQGGKSMSDLEQDGGIELIKTPVVIGENVFQHMNLTEINLDSPAIKIKDIETVITSLEAEAIIDRVLIQGTIHKEVYYVGEDNIIHHQRQESDFSYFIDIPGTEPGMTVVVEPNVEQVISKLIFKGKVLNQKDILHFFVKVLSVQQLIVETGTGPLVKVERVIGENSVQTMLMNESRLAVKAQKIADFQTEVVDLETKVINDKVIVQGVLHKQLYYIGKDDIEHHQAEDIPFNEFIDIPGAEAEMNVEIYPSVENIKQVLSPDEDRVNQRIILELFAKVTENVQINIVTGEDSLVMLPEVIGENVKQILNETTLGLNKPALNIKDIKAQFQDISAVAINDRVIVQGIIHKEIFYIGEDNVEYNQVENVNFSTFINVPGARPGMNIDVLPTIVFIKHRLKDGGTQLHQKVIGDIFVKVTEKIQFKVKEIESLHK